MNTEMNLKKLPVDLLKPAKYNPRKDLKPGDPAYEKIRRSLHDFGYGVICSTKHLSSGREGSSLKRLEKNREILVERSTDNNAKYWSESGKKTIMIRRA